MRFWRAKAPFGLAALLLLAFVFAFNRPITEAQALRYVPDSWDYLYGARSLLQGQFLVDWGPATGQRVPMYPPGFSLLLAPAILIGNGALQSGIFVSIFAALAIGILAASLAAHLSGRSAAPVAVLLAIFTPAVVLQSRLVMSDLASTAIVLAQLGLLVIGRRRPWAIFGAGLLAGYLVWLRYANVGLLPAGLFAITALGPAWRRNILLYAAGAAPILGALALWQFMSFGSPFLTTYDVGWPAGYEKPAFFSPLYLFGEPGGRDGRELAGLARTLALPNALIYPIQLIGGDAYLTLPFVGAIGLFGLVRFARKWGSAAVVGRFGLVVVIGTYALYAPYWYQSARFFQAPVAIEAVAAAAVVTAPGLALLRRLTARLGRPTVAAFVLAARRPFARV